MATAGNITAVLSLNASGFKTGLDNAKTSVEGFVSQITKSTGQVAGFSTALDGLVSTLNRATLDFIKFTEEAKGIESFNKFANGVKALATAIKTLGTNSETTATGVARVKEIIASMEGVFNGLEVKVTGVSNTFRELSRSAQSTGYNVKSAFEQAKAELMGMQTGLYRTGAVMSDAEGKAIYHAQQLREQMKMMKAEFNSARSDLMALANGGAEAFNKILTGVNRVNTTLNSSMNAINMYRVALQGIGTTASSLSTSFTNVGTSLSTYTSRIGNSTLNTNLQTSAMEKLSLTTSNTSTQFTKLSAEELKEATTKQRETTITNQSSSAHQRNANSMSQASARTNQLTSSTNRLKSAMSSLRMVGNLVGSMLAYNFAHKLLVATGETIHAKSEMEGYFKMLNFGQSDIDHFNQALDRTVSQFQRVNKYSLGETISSIGVEFNLTTQEMEKAMKVTSMITSEYLRAGRNANEASLAVKDVLQGQFQRLSRETGVKGEQLKEAGWSGDTTDVLGLMEALEKVGESRNWDVFAEKANSLNDIITILQNRFGEWSADMVNVVQPSIVNAFNAIMSVSQGLANILSGFWQWLNTDGWGQLAVKIGMIGTALLTTSQMLVMYRANVGLVEASQLGLKNSIASVVLGLKGQEVAEVGVRNAIMSKILGVNAEAIAENGVTGAIAQKIASLQASTIQEQANTLATGENTTAQTLSTSTTTGLATAKEMETAQEEVNTAMKELNTLETLKQEGANTGLIASLYMLGTAELYDAEATGVLATAWGVLNGVFALSPIGWIIAGITALAGAIYVLTGGLDSMWGSLQSAKSAIDDVDSALKPYKDNVEQTNKELEEAKEKYGENSLIVQQLQTKYDNAKTSLDTYYESLQKTTAQHKKLNDELAVTSAKMDEIMRDKLGTSGLSESEINSLSKDMQDSALLRDKDYVASQKYHAMLGNYSDDLEKYGKNVNYDKDALKDFNREYWNFIDYSNKANTSDNWWDWATNSFMAGVSSTSLDLQKAFHGVWDDNLGLNKYYDEINNWLTDIGNAISDFDLGKYFGDIASGVGEYFGNALGGVGESVQNFINDPLGSLGISLPDNWNILSLLGFDTVSASDGSETPTFMEDLSSILGFNIQSWLDNFTSDPLGTLGIDFSSFDVIGTLSKLIFGNGDGSEDTNDISWINSLFPPIDPSQIMTWVQDNLVTPLSTYIQTGIMNIPLVGDILALFGLVDGDNSGASQKGTDIGNAFKNKVEEIIRNIPIVGDVLQMLGLIPQANGDARSKGHGVGENIKQGEKDGHTGTSQNVGAEMSDVITAITNAVSGAFSAAQQVGNAIWDGINSIIKRASPGFIHDQILAEFGTDIPNAISGSGDVAYMVAQGYGQSVVDGISSVNFNSFGALATDYETDAQTMISTTQLLGLDTTMAFNDMALAVNTTTNTMGTNVIGTYNSMSTQQSSMLQNMKTQNMTAYNDMYQKSNQSLIQMRDSTSNLTAQMTNAWRHMKDQIVATANQLKSESTSHFNQLSNTIGEFYRKIQNPANWGANGRSPNAIPSRSSRSSSGRSIANAITSRSGGRFAGGRDVYNRSLGSSTMTIAQLKRKVCPTGNCDIFDGYSATTRVNPAEFLGMFADDYFFGWNDWNSTHYNYIKNKSDEWEMKSPQIQLMGGIDTDAKYKVGDFENGSPQISFESFQSMAESIFSVIPYRLYYNSDWKGSWLGALQAGACNCYDGASALIALANTCGFSGSMGSGSWGSYGHVWAIINGKIMDTTAWQGGYGWTSPKVSGYGNPNISARRATHNLSENNQSESVKVEVTINGNIYGVDDLDSHISESIDKGLEKHFNKAYTIGV